MSAASLMLLAGFTLAFMAAAARTIAGEGVEGHAGKFKVSPSVVLGFAVLGIVFDVASLVGFRVWSASRGSGHTAAAADAADGGSGGGGGGGGGDRGGGGGGGEGEGDDEGEGEGGAGRDGREGGEGGEGGEGSEGGEGGEGGEAEADGGGVEVSRWRLRRGYSALYQGCGGAGVAMCSLNMYSINMLSALLHVMSDLARSITTLVEGVLLHTHPELDGADVDAWSALVVCLLISLGLCGGVAKWTQEFRAYLRDPSHGAPVQREERVVVPSERASERASSSDRVSPDTPLRSETAASRRGTTGTVARRERRAGHRGAQNRRSTEEWIWMRFNFARARHILLFVL